MINTTFFTCCNKAYEEFILIFLDSVLYHNKDVVVEIGLEDFNQSAEIQEGIDYINDIYSNRVVLNIVDFNKKNINGKTYGVCPNVIRFIEKPKTENKYVYICDIDMIILQEDVTDIHVNDMNRTDLPYSNIVRCNQDIEKLTGLHFSKWNTYYPIPNYEDLALEGLLSHDEGFLYKLVSKKVVVSKKNTFRPVHGIHISPNRKKINGISYWKDKWIIYRNSDEFKFLEKLFSTKIGSFIREIDLQCLL